MTLADNPRPKKRERSLRRLNERGKKLSESPQRLRLKLKRRLQKLLLQRRPKRIAIWMIGRSQLLKMMRI